jgi:hypothetical protein
MVRIIEERPVQKDHLAITFLPKAAPLHLAGLVYSCSHCKTEFALEKKDCEVVLARFLDVDECALEYLFRCPIITCSWLVRLNVGKADLHERDELLAEIAKLEKEDRARMKVSCCEKPSYFYPALCPWCSALANASTIGSMLPSRIFSMLCHFLPIR